MSTKEYGQYGVFTSWLEIITILITLRMPFGVFNQGLVKYSEDRKRYASSMQGLSLVLCMSWTGIYLLFQRFFNSLLGFTTVQMLAMMVMIWSSTAFQFWAAEQRVEYRYRALVVATAAISTLKIMLEILCVLHSLDKVTARILGLALAELVGYSGLFYVQMRRGKQFYSKQYWKRAMILNIPLIPHYLSQTVLNSADRIMIREMVGKSEAGIYSLGYSVSKVMTLFNQALTQTISPWIYQRLKSNRVSDIREVVYPALIGVAGLNLILIAFAPEIVSIFAPDTYQRAIWVVPPVAMSVLFIFSYGIFSTFEFYFEKTYFLMIASVSGAALNIALNYIFIPQYGFYVAGYTTLACYIVYAVGHYCFLRIISKNYLEGIEVFRTSDLLSIAIIFLLSGTILLLSYYNLYLRYSLIAVIMFFLIWKKDSLLKYIDTLIILRKAKVSNGKEK